LDYEQWRQHFQQGRDIAQHPRQMRIDFTLTLPGLFEVDRIQSLAQEMGVEILAKVIFSFTPDIVMSPLALPRELLDAKVDTLTAGLPNGALKDVLLQLKNRPTFEQQWPGEWQAALTRGKQRVLKLEHIRNDTFTLERILEENDKEIYDWWKKIPA
jgi:hypothetical protein